MTIVKEILNFNKETQKQRGLGLKILAPDQMLSRLPISLAQLNAGNNSEKLKKEIIIFFVQIKKLAKSVYKSLVGVI